MLVTLASMRGEVLEMGFKPKAPRPYACGGGRANPFFRKRT